MEAYDRQHGDDQPQTVLGNVYQVGIRREHVYDCSRKELAEQETQSSGTDGAENGVFQGADHPVVLFRSEIVAYDRLHSLVKTHDDHKKQERNPVNDTECTYIHIASEGFEAVVDE